MDMNNDEPGEKGVYTPADVSGGFSMPARMERQFEMLVQAVVDYAIYMLDPSGRIVSWNSGAQEIKGYAAEEVLGRHFAMLHTEEDRRAGVPAQVLAIAREEGRYNGEVWRVRRDGSRFRALVAVDAIRDEKGELLGFAQITRDITLQWEAAMRLEASERRFRLFVEGARDYAICMLDAQGRILDWNAGDQRMTGYSRIEVLGRDWSTLLAAPDGAVARRMLARSEGGDAVEEEHDCRRKDDSTFPARVTVQALRDHNGILHGHALVLRDISRLRATESQLETTREQLAQSRRIDALGQLTAGVAHDFNNMLQAMAGSLDVTRLLIERGDTDKAERHLQNAMKSVERARNLTQRLVAFTRRQPLRMSRFDLGREIAAMVDLLDRTMGPGISVRLELGHEPLLICSDLNQLETALLNLAINSRDAMPDGGCLRISASRLKGSGRGDRAQVTVEDDGAGMSASLIARAFEPFFTTKSQGQGTGLGLSMIQSFMEQSGGEVTLASTPGEGTRVSLVFPLDE